MEQEGGMNLNAAESKNETKDVYTIETLYLRNGRDKASFEDVKALIEGHLPSYAYNALIEDDYSQFSKEQKRDLARAIVATKPFIQESNKITFSGLAKIVVMAELEPEEMIAELQRIKENR